MPRKRSKNGGGGRKDAPQNERSTLQLNVFQPRRRIKVATQALVTNLTPVLALGFDNSIPPGTALDALTSLLDSFDRTRVVSISVFFDQRGSASQAAIPRCTAWVAEDNPSAVDVSKIDSLARFSGSGMTQVFPGRSFNVRVGPEFRSGRFEPQVQQDTLLIATHDYRGTVRIETTFEAYGPPLAYRIIVPQDC